MEVLQNDVGDQAEAPPDPSQRGGELIGRTDPGDPPYDQISRPAYPEIASPEPVGDGFGAFQTQSYRFNYSEVCLA